MSELEELAERIGRFACYSHEAYAAREAAAAACRELASLRRPMSLRMPGLNKATDAAIAEWKGVSAAPPPSTPPTGERTS
jgi:hypothetical protein